MNEYRVQVMREGRGGHWVEDITTVFRYTRPYIGSTVVLRKLTWYVFAVSD